MAYASDWSFNLYKIVASSLQRSLCIFCLWITDLCSLKSLLWSHGPVYSVIESLECDTTFFFLNLFLILTSFRCSVKYILCFNEVIN